MSITITEITDDEEETWDGYVARSRQGTVFHRYAALETQAEHTGSTLHPLVGYKGEEPVGLFPVFEHHKGPLSLAFSPPPEIRVAYLGPALLNVEKLSQRKTETRHTRFIDGCVEWMDDEFDPQYVSVGTGWRYDDVRPFKWNEFVVEPSYTYVVVLDVAEEEVIGRFSRTTRRRIKNHLDEEYTITLGGREAIEMIVDQVNERYDEQDKSTPLTASFVSDLYDALPDGKVRPYVLSIGGEPVTGTILLEEGETAHRWQGGVKPDVDLPANELLEWYMMRDAMDRGVTRYDIVDANFPRLNRWKAKFGPETRSYFNLKRSGRGIDLAARVHELLR